MSDSAVLKFFSGEGTDHRGRTLHQILAWTDVRLETSHDYIQWLFPTGNASAYQPGAPVVSEAEAEEFRRSYPLKRALEDVYREYPNIIGPTTLEFWRGAL